LRGAALLLGSVIASSIALAAPFDGPTAGITAIQTSSTDREQRWTVGNVVVRLSRSPGPDQAATDPTCAGNGTDLFVEGAPDAPTAAAIDRACHRLTFDAPSFADATPREHIPAASASTMVALHGLAIAWVLSLLWALPRRREPWAWALGALALRAWVAPAHVLMGVAYPYDYLLTYAGLRSPNLRYGAGWPALMDVLRPLAGAAPERLHDVNLALSALTVVCVWQAVERWTRDDVAARLSALTMALLPLPFALATTETSFVLVALLGAASLAGLARADRAGAWSAGLSAALLAHTRPDAIPVAVVVALALVASRRVGPSFLAVAAIGARVAFLATADFDAPPPGLTMLERIAGTIVGRHSATVVLDPTVTPFWLVPAGLFGAWCAWRRGQRGAVALLALLVLAATGPYLIYERVTDLARFGLSAQSLWVVLAGLGAADLGRGGVGRRAVWLAVMVAGLWVARAPLGGPMVHRVEHAFARVTLCAQPPGTRIRYDAARDPDAGMARFFQVVCGVALRAIPADGVMSPGELVWRGVGDRWPAAHPPERCTVDPVAARTTPAWDGGLEPIGDGPVSVGLFRVRDCR
jgi:hypothetical protein